MKIKLINKFDSVIEAWKYSRPALTESEIDSKAIRDLDLPVNEFCVMHLQIECSIIEREIIASYRDHVIWAQGSRINEVEVFQYAANLYNDTEIKEIEDCRARIISAKKSGQRQDDFRLNLPIVSLTKFNIIMSARGLQSLASTMEHLSKKTSGSMRKLLFRSFYNISLFLNLNSDYNYVSARKPLAMNEKPLEGSGVTGNFGVITVDCNFSLRTHMVRHRQVQFSDNFLEIIMAKNAHRIDLNSKVRMQISGHVDDLRKMVSSRSCWIAQYNIWKGVIKEIGSIMTIDTEDLPCADGVCPWKEDAAIRLTDKDPNAPCPIHVRLEGVTPNSLQIAEMHEQRFKDERQDFWIDEINKLEPAK